MTVATPPTVSSRVTLAGLLLVALASGWLVAQDRAPDPAAPTTQPATTQPALVDDAAAFNPLTARENLASGLIGSKHDFRKLNESVRDLCLPCHTPHVGGAPTPKLDQRETQTRPLQPYIGADTELTGWSLLCLGCHDGVTAQDVYSSAHAITISDQLANSRLGVRGLRSHPVGIHYPAPREDYHPSAAVEAAGLPLPDGRIQCATCHDAHNTLRHAGMLRISNSRSRLCLTCHRR